MHAHVLRLDPHGAQRLVGDQRMGQSGDRTGGVVVDQVVVALDDKRNQMEMQELLKCRMAGIKVMEARISHLAYAPEIAEAMLRRQQATAVVAARRRSFLQPRQCRLLRRHSLLPRRRRFRRAVRPQR